MIAINFHALAIDRNALSGSHMAVDLFEPRAKAVLNHLHPPANTQDGQVPTLGQIQQRSLGFVPIRRIAAIGRQIVPPGKDNPANVLAYRQCGVHGIRYRNWNNSAAEQKLYPRLIQAVATRAVRRVYHDPLGDGNGLHAMT
jgi:hypothetical protein